MNSLQTHKGERQELPIPVSLVFAMDLGYSLLSHPNIANISQVYKEIDRPG